MVNWRNYRRENASVGLKFCFEGKMQRIIKMLGIITVLVLLTGIAQAGDWPMFRHDAAHTGYTDEKVPDELELLWSFETEGAVRSSPAVADGKVFVGSGDNCVYALDKNTGKLIWSYETGGEVKSSPAVANGKVFVGSNDHNIYCLNEVTGKLIWSYEIDGIVRSSPTAVDGNVFVGSGLNHKGIYCFDENDGKTIWINDEIFWADSSSPAVVDGKVFIGSKDNKIYCLDENSGKGTHK